MGGGDIRVRCISRRRGWKLVLSCYVGRASYGRCQFVENSQFLTSLNIAIKSLSRFPRRKRSMSKNIVLLMMQQTSRTKYLDDISIE